MYSYMCIHRFTYIFGIYIHLEYTHTLEKIFLSFLPSSGDFILLDLQSNNGLSPTVRVSDMRSKEKELCARAVLCYAQARNMDQWPNNKSLKICLPSET